VNVGGSAIAGSDMAEPVKSGDAGDIVRGLARVSTPGGRSLASKVLGQRNKLKMEKDDTEHSMMYLFRRMGGISRDSAHVYAFGVVAAIATGMLYPVFGIGTS